MGTLRDLGGTDGAAGGDIPAAGVKAFKEQAAAARQRGIPFHFDLATWWRWWAVDGRWSRRGRGRDRLVMARHGDRGPYAPGNVYCTTFSGNLRDVDPERRRAAAFKVWADERARGRRRSHLRGAAAPWARAVVTPAGMFASTTAAGRAHGITRTTAAYRAGHRRKGWRWATPEEVAALRADTCG